jgi:hypothetical protein
MSRSGEASSGGSIDDLVRSEIMLQITVPSHLTEHGALAYAREVVRRAESLARELDLMAVEARARGQRPEHTEASIDEACDRQERAQRDGALRQAAEATQMERVHARRRGRLRRRWSVVLTTFGTAGISVHDVAGSWGTATFAVSVLQLLGGAVLTLISGE